jgi:hypothetical protein
VGKRLSASTAAVAGTVAGLVNGAGLLTSLLMGGAIFFLLITAIAQTIFKCFLPVVGAVEAVVEVGALVVEAIAEAVVALAVGEHQVHGNENRNNRNCHLS